MTERSTSGSDFLLLGTSATQVVPGLEVTGLWHRGCLPLASVASCNGRTWAVIWKGWGVLWGRAELERRGASDSGLMELNTCMRSRLNGVVL